MNPQQNAAVLAALETQLRELATVLARLERARRDLVPGPANFWRGTARLAYDAAMDGIGLSVDAGVAAVRSARDRTGDAVVRMSAGV